MSRVTNELGHTHEWVMPYHHILNECHTVLIHVTLIENKSCHVTNELCHTHERVSHKSNPSEACHTHRVRVMSRHEWVVSHSRTIQSITWLIPDESVWHVSFVGTTLSHSQKSRVSFVSTTLSHSQGTRWVTCLLTNESCHTMSSQWVMSYLQMVRHDSFVRRYDSFVRRHDSFVRRHVVSWVSMTCLVRDYDTVTLTKKSCLITNEPCLVTKMRHDSFMSRITKKSCLITNESCHAPTHVELASHALQMLPCIENALHMCCRTYLHTSNITWCINVVCGYEFVTHMESGSLWGGFG